MKYAILGLYGERGKGVYIQSSDTATLQWIGNQAKTLMPTAVADHMLGQWQVPTTKDKGKTYHGETYSLRLSSLGGRDTDVAWWLIKHLCASGWEPMSPEFDLKNQQTVTLYLRFEQ